MMLNNVFNSDLKLGGGGIHGNHLTSFKPDPGATINCHIAMMGTTIIEDPARIQARALPHPGYT